MSTTRCAIYTRKSSEEGLEQAFNSLDAQREAGADYVRSQRHQGWVVIDTAYDDGGYSGGSTDRPGLRRLLDDIGRGRVDVVLVYKVDRLSRSLADFARLMQVFDQHRVSFVSVTQQFNTTTSMGRLTLNMLLSFAQFEREVAGERIRDKIAATKRKGAWVCGQPPLGYALCREGEAGPGFGASRLRIIEPEAELVRAVYAGYLELGSLVALAARLNALGHTTKVWTSTSGRAKGGRPLTTAYLYRMLTNPLYVGKIAHTRGKGRDATTDVHDGVHEAIIDQPTWDRVRAAMDLKAARTAGAWTHTHLLKGKLRTRAGHAMSPGSVQRPISRRDPERGVRRIRYYVSQRAIKHGYASCEVRSVNAEHLDDLVRALVIDYLRERCPDVRLDLRGVEAGQRDHWVREVVAGVRVGPAELAVEIDQCAASRCAAELRTRGNQTGRAAAPVPSCPFTPDVAVDADARRTTLNLAIQIKRLDGRRVLVAPDGRDLLATLSGSGGAAPRQHLVRAIAQAHAWKAMLLARGDQDHVTLRDVARRSGVAHSRVNLLLPLASLSPRITAAALAGTLPASVGVADLVRAAAHHDWARQARLLGLPD